MSQKQILWMLGLIAAIAGPLWGVTQSQMAAVIERTEGELERQAEREASCEELLRETLRLLHGASDEETGTVDPAHASAIAVKMEAATRCLDALALRPDS